jgi:hypothetical protein
MGVQQTSAVDYLNFSPTSAKGSGVSQVQGGVFELR